MFSGRRPGGLLLWVAALGLASCGSPAPQAPGDWSGRRVVFLGIDGATWDVLDPMMERGELPNFRALVRRGARADLVSLPPLRSPVVWTTYATGELPRSHFILDFVYPYVPGRKRAVESSQRRQPAIWNVAGEYGRRVGVVGYYATSPVEPVEGFVVSDRSLEGLGGRTWPPELAAGLDLVRTRDQRDALFDRFYPWDYDPERPAATADRRRVDEIVSRRVDWAILRDENVRRVTLDLMSRPVDLFMAYFRIVDHASHATWFYYDDTEFERRADATGKARLGDLIPESYRFIDDMLGEVVAAAGPDVNVVIVSDHGFGPAVGPHAIEDPELVGLLSGSHRHDGIFLGAGPDFEPGEHPPLNALDVAPLLFALGGIPLSEELPGGVPLALLSGRFRDENLPGSTAAYGFAKTAAGEPLRSPGVDDERLERLKALGYVGGSVAAGRDAEPSPEGFWTIDPRLRREAVEGELLYYLTVGNREAIVRLLVAVRRRDPELFSVLPKSVAVAARRLQADFSQPVIADSALALFRKAYGSVVAD